MIASQNWSSLHWTEWVPFHGGDFKALPTAAGIYRVRVRDQNQLAYIGQTGRNLRERLSDLRRNTLAKEMPFNDPHTAAPSLWAWRDAEGYEYECSAFTSGADAQNRQAIECWLLWQYRLESGGSTLCNHGHFHPHYVKSKDRKTGFRGHRLEAPGDHIQSTTGLTNSDDGSMGLDWTDWQQLDELDVPNSPGVYRIADGTQVIYIGESSGLRSRLNAHARTDWGCERPSASYCVLSPDTPKQHLHEIENDLIAGHYHPHGSPPAMQFRDTKVPRDQRRV